MAIIVKTSDFKGRYSISLPANGEMRNEIIEEIDSLEKRELILLFGKDLFDEFEANPEGIKFEPLYQYMTDDFRRNEMSEGLVYTIVAFIYFTISKDAYFLPTIGGRIQKEPENGIIIKPTSRDLELYNQNVVAWRVMQRFCLKNYPNFKGSDKRIKFY